MFSGFFRPRSNCYRLPNDWFDVWADARRQTGRARILGPLKATEYVIKRTWGYRNYDEPVRITRLAIVTLNVAKRVQQAQLLTAALGQLPAGEVRLTSLQAMESGDWEWTPLVVSTVHR